MKLSVIFLLLLLIPAVVWFSRSKIDEFSKMSLRNQKMHAVHTLKRNAFDSCYLLLKITVNPELVTMKPLLLREIQG